MTRGARVALWGGTALISLGIVLLGVPEARAGAVMAWIIALHLVRSAGLDASLWLISVGGAAMLAGLTLRWMRHRAAPERVIRRLAVRGASVATIARVTGLAQDAVRDCLRVRPIPAHAAPSAGRQSSGGMLFRHGSARSAPPGADFGALLRESASRTTT